jgi:acyl dehydratase
MNLEGNPVRVGDRVQSAVREVAPEIVAFYRGTLGEGAESQFAPPLLYHSEVYQHAERWYLKNLVGNLHARQEWEMFAPIQIGRPLHTRSTVVERYRRRGRDFVVNEVDYTDPEGTLLVRGRTHQSFLASEVDAQTDVVSRETARGKKRRPVGEGDGPELAPFSTKLSLETCWRFSGPGKNYHTDREAARKWGFPDVVVQGMFSTCLISRLMSEHFDSGWLRGGRMDLKLVNVLWGGEGVRTRGKQIDEVPEGELQRRIFEVWVEKEDDDHSLVTVGTASALI